MSVQQVGEPDESRNENVLRPFINIRRSADLADDPAIHDGDTVGHRQRLFLVVGDIHRGYIHPALDLLDGIPHFDTEFRVQIGQRFIHQKYLRPDDDRPRKGDTLLLPAGKRCGHTVFQVVDLHDLQDFIHPLFDFLFRHLPHPQTESHIIFHRHVGENGVILEDHAHISFICRHIVDNFPVDRNRTAFDGIESDNHTEQCRFTAARRP